MPGEIPNAVRAPYTEKIEQGRGLAPSLRTSVDRSVPLRDSVPNRDGWSVE